MYTTNAGKLGQWGEGIAAEYLEQVGYTVLDRNYHTPVGEIDIVAVNEIAKYPGLVFVEVKTRTSKRHGYPEESVGKKKWDHLQAAIQYYLEAHPDINLEWCVDVIAIVGHPDQKSPQIQHYKNVVMADERD